MASDQCLSIPSAGGVRFGFNAVGRGRFKVKSESGSRAGGLYYGNSNDINKKKNNSIQ